MRRLLILIAVLAGVAFSQDAPTLNPLNDKEKLQAAESFILLQNSQQQMLASPTWRLFQQRQQEYLAVVRAFQQAKGVPLNCTLNVKQEWACPAPAISQSSQGPGSVNVVGDNNVIGNKGDEKKEPDGESNESDQSP